MWYANDTSFGLLGAVQRGTDAVKDESHCADLGPYMPDIDVALAFPEPTRMEEHSLFLAKATDTYTDTSPDLLEKICFPALQDLPSDPYSNDVWLHHGLRGSILTKDIVPSTLLSGFVHLCLVLIMTMVPTYGTGSNDNRAQGAVMVKLVEQNSDVIPTDESPGSLDARASLPMVARRAPRRKDNTAEAVSVPQQPLLEPSGAGTKEVPSVQDLLTQDHYKDRDKRTSLKEDRKSVV